ncbi:hypothetical protein HPB51_028645 [Rhipicephalus microplus]|uniref:Ribosomal RNA-processing protein 14/surfeit locus protein 6 C-terminal domain-containing protein n=1 Tax=Rhipicephalus microplus TaxID=6941 RepID=A0A9J6CX80_RHIMP|nr:hypothetical protein HPB51_028645 [Rhipicephalus microplus]
MLCKGTEHSTDLLPGASPYARQPCRCGKKDRDFMELQCQVFHAQGSVTKTAQLEHGLYQTASQLLQAKKLKTKKQRDAKTKRKRKNNKQTTKSAAKPTQNKQHKLKQESLATASNPKTGKAPQGAAAFYRDSYAVCSKLELTGQSPSTDAKSNVEKEQDVVHQLEKKAEKVKHLKECEMCCAKGAPETRKCHWALYKEEQIKVRGDCTLRKAPLKLCEKRQQKSRKKWNWSTANVKLRQIECHQKRRDIIKVRQQVKL